MVRGAIVPADRALVAVAEEEHLPAPVAARWQVLTGRGPGDAGERLRGHTLAPLCSRRR